MTMDEIGTSAHDYSYDAFLDVQRQHFAAAIEGQVALFATDAGDLFKVYLDALPPEQRQFNNCHACKRFVESYGGLVTIDDLGQTTPVMWGDALGIYIEAFRAVRRAVAKAKVTGVFLAKEGVVGMYSNPSPKAPDGEWHHLAVKPPSTLVFKHSILTAGQAMAERHEEYAMLQRGLAEFPEEVVAQALRVLEADALYRSEKVIGPAMWLRDLHIARERAADKQARENLTWRAVATAPPGFCHVRSTMIGTLLEDVVAGLPFEAVKARFGEKMHPLQYQRPQAPPAAGNIAQAEKMVATLKSAGAFARRFAKLEDLETIWRPKPPAPAQPPVEGAVFGHLTPKGHTPKDKGLELPAITMTWDKFARTVLPEAERVEWMVPHGRAHLLAMVTAADPAAVPILQWDSEECRNPVNWYVYPGGSRASDWNLQPGTWASVSAVSFLPFMWHGGAERASHHGAGVVFVLEGCRDLRPTGGAALFPEVLKADYHGIRATIEAHSRSLPIAGVEEASACGVDLRKGQSWSERFRITTKSGRQGYLLDRWD